VAIYRQPSPLPTRQSSIFPGPPIPAALSEPPFWPSAPFSGSKPLLLFPALGLYLLLEQKTDFQKPAGFFKPLLLSALVGLLPLLLYLYLPLRGHIGSLDGTYQNTWAGFWRQVSAGGYGAFIFDNPFGRERDAAFYWHLFNSQFYTLLPGFIGLFYLSWQGPRKFLILTGTAFLTHLIFNLFYNAGDIEVFFIPSFVLWAAWSGMGAAFLLQAAVQANGRATVNGQRSMVNSQYLTFAVSTLVLAIFIFVIFQLFQTNQPILAARNTWQVHDHGLDLLQQPLPKNAAIVGILGEMTLLRYFQQTEIRRPDIETVAADVEADRLDAV
jgi:hypothetical protein